MNVTEAVKRQGHRPDSPSPRPWKPLKHVSKGDADADNFENEYYQVTRHTRADGLVCIGISNTDQSAQRDWREFQQIKNELVGAETLAVEIFPPESEKVDPSNYFVLFAGARTLLAMAIAQDHLNLRPGERCVVGSDEADAPQRTFVTQTSLEAMRSRVQHVLGPFEGISLKAKGGRLLPMTKAIEMIIDSDGHYS